mgnify:CR=1 FL=1
MDSERKEGVKEKKNLTFKWIIYRVTKGNFDHKESGIKK